MVKPYQLNNSDDDDDDNCSDYLYPMTTLMLELLLSLFAEENRSETKI